MVNFFFWYMDHIYILVTYYIIWNKSLTNYIESMKRQISHCNSITPKLVIFLSIYIYWRQVFWFFFVIIQIIKYEFLPLMKRVNSGWITNYKKIENLVDRQFAIKKQISRLYECIQCNKTFHLRNYFKRRKMVQIKVYWND